MHILDLADGRIRTPYEDGFGIHHVCRLVAGRVVAHAQQAAHGEVRSSIHRLIEVCDARCRQEAAGHPTDRHPVYQSIVSGTREQTYRRRTKLLHVAVPFLGNLIESLIPANALPLIRPALASATQRVLQTLVAINTIRVAETLHADTVVLRIGHLAHGRTNHLAVAHVHVKEAAAGAVATADAGKDLRLGGFLLRFGFFQVLGLGAAAYQRARRRQRCRTLDEAPAGEPIRCLFSHVCSSLFHSSAARPSDARPSQIAGRGSRSAKGGVKSLVPPGLS